MQTNKIDFMKLKHNDIIIPEDGSNPFVNCKLDRKQYADVLTSIVESYADGFVLAINNPWGEGKSTFVKMWQQQLANSDYKTLYYNAWENDFENDVLVALISELGAIKNKPIATFNNVLNKAVGLTAKVLPKAAKHLVKKAIGSDAAQDIVESVFEFGTEDLKEQITNYTKRKKSIQDFKDNLEIFVSEVGEGKPIVFVIDELDRCRPNYAVQVLEQVKHLFTVPGIVFVLSIDKVQLGHAVRGVYGNVNIDADEYLRRFIDLEYVIPKPQLVDFINYLYKYFDFDSFLKSDSRVEEEAFKHDRKFFKQHSYSFFAKEFSLRQIEKIFARIRVTLKMFRINQYVFPQIIIFLAYLKEKKGDIYHNIKDCNYTVNELVDNIEPILLTFLDEENKDAILSLYATMLKFYLNYFKSLNPSTTEVLGDYSEAHKMFKINFESQFEDENSSLSLLIEHYFRMRIANTDLSFIMDKLELTENIVS